MKEMANKKTQYYCFECRFAKSAYGSLICQVYRGAILVISKACLDFELKKDFKRRADKRKKE